jgi:hypothetical protein
MTRKTHVEQIMPAKDHGIIKSRIHAEYAEGFEPSHTGDQYSEYANAIGTATLRFHFNPRLTNLAQIKVKAADSTPTTNAPDSSERELRRLRMADVVLIPVKEGALAAPQSE